MRFFLNLRRPACVMALLLAGMGVNYGAEAVRDTNRTDAKGRRQGVWVRKPSADKLGYTGQFKDDMPTGRFVYTALGDTLVTEAFYFRGGYASYNRYFYPDGSLMAEGYYLDKQKDSVWKMYARSGQLIREESFENGLLHGRRLLYDADGTVLEDQHWFRGLRNGNWFVHDEKGYQLSTYKLNITHGLYTARYPDSTRFIEGHYDEGLKEGLWRFYLPSGTLYKEDTYSRNQLVNRTLYLKIGGELRAVSTDTVPLVMRHPQGGRAELLASSGKRLVCDEKFETVCGIFDLDFYFFANKNTLVSFTAVDKDRIADALAQTGDDRMDKVDGQLDFSQQLGRNASVSPVLLPLNIKTPYPVYMDADGMDVLRNDFKNADVEAE
ncbi:MAG: hypothetical protein NC396_06940 [Bacteroides sp.]|nr:hypothetical protein [Bacteroides sp.]MCM1086089.1 hypothetical protein [Bacteroides sp.]